MDPVNLGDYDITAERGFLCGYDAAAVVLPGEFAPIVEAASDLPRTLASGRVRAHLKQLPPLDIGAFCADAPEPEIRSAFVRYAFLVQAYVWGRGCRRRGFRPCWRCRSGRSPTALVKSRC